MELTNGSTYANALNANAYNHLDFAPITAKFLRIRVFGVMGTALVAACCAGGRTASRWSLSGSRC